MLYPFPSPTLWCNGAVSGIADLEGKKIRICSTTLDDFVEGVGGVSVTVAFSQVIPALEKGVVDCEIGETGDMTHVTPSAEDVVLSRWAERCSEACTTS